MDRDRFQSMAGWRRRRRARTTAESVGEEADEVQERAEVLIEGTAKVAELAEEDRAAASLDRPPGHAEAFAAGAWHGTADMPGSELPEALDAFSGILGAVVAGVGMAATDAVLREHARHKRQMLLLKQLAEWPVIVDPAVSFAPGSSCFLVAQPGGELTVLPGHDLAADEAGVVLDPAAARAWARQLLRMSEPGLTPEQAAAITAWTGRAGRAGPAVIVMSPQPTIAAAPDQDVHQADSRPDADS